MPHFIAIDPKAAVEAYEDRPIGNYSRGVRHTQQRVTFRTAAGLITTTMALPPEEPEPEPEPELVWDIDFTPSRADLRPIRRL